MADDTVIGHCPKCFTKQHMTLRSFMAQYKGRKRIAPPHYQLICPVCGIVFDELDLATVFDKDFEAHAIHLGKYAELDLYRRGLYKYKLHYRDDD